MLSLHAGAIVDVKTIFEVENMAIKMQKALRVIFLMMALNGLAACNPQSAGFALPPGNVDAGRTAFVELECNYCHFIPNDVAKLDPGSPDINFILGGSPTRIKGYGDLVTSIINPSHRISRDVLSRSTDDSGQSAMLVYNDYMTVQQMVDLTTYLQDTYELVEPTYTPYQY
jgi:hypothetical protein